MTMKLLLLSLTIFLTVTISQGQTSLSLISKNNKYKIKVGDDCYIKTIPTSNDTANNYYNIHIGYITSFKDSILTLTTRGLNTVYYTKDGVKKLDRVGLDSATVNLNIKEIEEIENFRRWFTAPATIGWLSLVSAIVVSPLVSTNFKAKTFDTDKFVKVSGVSLGTAAISLTIAYGFGRHSSFINNGQKRHRRLWVIQE